jgi:probable poly-beta-1,6-N-acetyl-D-glucosamine export protein
MTAVSETSTRRETDTFLRGLAISCVVLIHFLSAYRISPFIHGAEFQTLAVTFDQLGRLSVPLFVALSGYGLALKYQHSAFKWSEYLKKRVFKLIPLYVLWSYIYWFVFLFMPQWRPTSEMKPFFGQLFFGNADYHLYFVPMIFQLYLLFPVLLHFTKKKPWLILLVTGIVQVGFYYVVSQSVTSTPGTAFFQSDQKQYVWFFTWIFYFILGMSMTKVVAWIKEHSITQWLIYSLLIGSGVWVAVSALSAINSGVDPLVALRFTRLPILVYATLAITSLFLLLEKHRPLPKALLFVGNNSYSIYLGHTLLLRIIFLFINPPL